MSVGPEHSGADCGLRETDRDYLTFGQRLEAGELGHYSPGGAPTLMPPLETLNPFPKATLLHEEIHQELTLATTSGGFLLFFVTLAEFGRNRQICRHCFKHQWQVQEAAATYAGLAVVATLGPAEFQQAVERLPSRINGQSPYREVFDYVAEFLPLVPGVGKARLKAQVATIVAIAHCSLNVNCYVRFQDPKRLTEETLDRYFTENSPDVRFRQILETLGTERINCLADEIEREMNLAKDGFNPTRYAMRKVAPLVPQLPSVVELPEIQAQHRAFCRGWQEHYREWTGEKLELEPGSPRAFRIPQPSGQLVTTPMSLTHLESVLRECIKDGWGLWAVIYMENKEKLKLDVLPCKMDTNNNPSPEMDAVRNFLRHGFLSGVFRSENIVALFRRYTGFPQAITFIKWSWFFWREAGGDSLELPDSVFVALDRELKEESIEVHMRFRNLRPGAEYFRISYDESQAMACIINRQIPRVYALQYLAGDAGLAVFRSLASQFEISKSTPPDSHTVHLPLLRLMSLPAFQLADPDAGIPLLVIMKLLHWSQVE